MSGDETRRDRRTRHARPDVRCSFCMRWHQPTFLCGPAKRVLDALKARGMQFNMPSIEFPEPVEQVCAPGDVVLRQLVVEAAVITVGVTVSALVFTGQSTDGLPLPRWILPADDPDLDRTVALVTDMAEMAKRAAERARQQQQT